jgi:hypothetical protein
VLGGLTQLQYANDTVICLETDDESISNIKFLLYCFENMSGLKINYNKSEVMAMGVSAEESSRIARLLSCKEGALPMKYLGILVNSTKLYLADLMYVGVKVEKKLPAWQGLHLSSRGKSILIESSLSSLPMYTMGVYLLPEEVHHKIDSTRAGLNWDAGQKKKYHMVKWEELARLKEHGGLGFTETRLMNMCMLSKWIFKLERGDRNMCCDLLRKKYLRGKGFFGSSQRDASQIWKGLHEAKKFCQGGMKYILGDGKRIRFWHEVWLGECPLRIRFSKMFSICNQQEWEVTRVLRNGIF